VDVGWGVAGVDRAGIDRVERDRPLGELVGQRAGDRREGALAGGVGDLVSHGAEVLPGSHEDDAPAGAPVVLGGEGLRQQDGGSSGDGPVRVEHRGIEGAEWAVTAAAGVVADEDVEVPERPGRHVHQLAGRAGGGQVQLDVVNACAAGQGFGHAGDHSLRPTGVGAPRLVLVVPGAVVQEQAGAQRGQPASDRIPNAGASACPGHQGHPAAQRQRVSLRGKLAFEPAAQRLRAHLIA